MAVGIGGGGRAIAVGDQWKPIGGDGRSMGCGKTR